MSADRSDYHPSQVGHPVVIWEGWGTNPARNNGADIYTMPIQPQHYSNFTATQTQLFNGLQLSNFGRRDSYDNYLRAIQSSAVNAGSKNQKQLFPGFQPAGTPQASAKQLNQMIQDGAPKATGDGGVGIFAQGVSFVRSYYG
jgi:hypothetical protein